MTAQRRHGNVTVDKPWPPPAGVEQSAGSCCTRHPRWWVFDCVRLGMQRRLWLSRRLGLSGQQDSRGSRPAAPSGTPFESSQMRGVTPRTRASSECQPRAAPLLQGGAVEEAQAPQLPQAGQAAQQLRRRGAAREHVDGPQGRQAWGCTARCTASACACSPGQLARFTVACCRERCLTHASRSRERRPAAGFGWSVAPALVMAAETVRLPET